MENRGAGQLGGALEVQDSQIRTDVPVVLRLEREFPGFAPGPDHRVVFLGFPRRCGLVRDIGHSQHELPEVLFDAAQFFFDSGDLLADLPHFLTQWPGIFAGLHQPADLPGAFVAIPLEFLHFTEEVATAAVHLLKRFHGQGLAPACHRLGDGFQIFTDEMRIKHGSPSRGAL